ncbi:4Fe-4S binding protein [Maribellus sp. YY47]|uniref:4Fe-4S binding protein n=1 Tax=Maribellus sp. YY47 TaxID=2929486 RepID=UPI0020018B91|nr:4Fe-4S binding protein [Maribellus sp. YY47]MCK3683399.1 4Fe-4S binding protein [Maribellus sp. YY47]
MKPTTKNTNWPRLIVQWGILAFILILAFLPGFTKITAPDFEAYCPFGGLQALGSYLLSQALSCTMTSAQIVMGVILFAGILLFSKLFCSYVCPIGTVSETLGKLGDKLKIRFTIKGIADKILRSLKYILLFVTLYYTLQSNELFCKKFDPYFALASGFNSDVELMYALGAIALVIFGSIFIRLFWCKYLCPLGAISNLFKFSLFFIALLFVYIILLQAGINISYVWPLAIACIGGYIIEIGGLKSRFTPAAKITRSTGSCINCKLCSNQCHQAIDVASLKVVNNVDCNLCGDCLEVCPVEKTLTINQRPKLKRLPVIALVALVALGITLGNVWEVPTIDLRWANAEQLGSAAEFTQTGLKNIKCYGSSMAFANKMRELDGIYGVATFVEHNKVKLLYDDSRLTEEKIQEAMFTPQKKTIRPVSSDIDTVYGITFRLDNFFDDMDFSYLNLLLYYKTNAVGMISEFDCPVMVKILFPNKIENIDSLVTIIESKSLTVESQTGDKVTYKLGYEVAGKPELFEFSKGEYLNSLFIPYKRSFNYRSTYSDDVLNTYKIPLGKNTTVYNRISYLVSHLSNDDGIVEFKTELDSSYREQVVITFVDSMTNTINVENALLSDSLSLTYSSGNTGKVPNMFDFSDEITKD